MRSLCTEAQRTQHLARSAKNSLGCQENEKPGRSGKQDQKHEIEDSAGCGEDEEAVSKLKNRVSLEERPNQAGTGTKDQKNAQQSLQRHLSNCFRKHDAVSSGVKTKRNSQSGYQLWSLEPG